MRNIFKNHEKTGLRLLANSNDDLPSNTLSGQNKFVFIETVSFDEVWFAKSNRGDRSRPPPIAEIQSNLPTTINPISMISCL